MSIEFDQATSNITCVFLRQLVGSSSNNSCIIMYAPESDCQDLSSMNQGWTSSDTVIINIPGLIQGIKYCFMAIASSTSTNFTVVVEGRFMTAGSIIKPACRCMHDYRYRSYMLACVNCYMHDTCMHGPFQSYEYTLQREGEHCISSTIQ